MDRLIDRIRRFVQELRRRRVFRVAIVYAGTAFIVLQICDIVFPALRLPEWAMTLVVVLLLAGAPIALIAAWAFEITPEGVVRVTEREDAEREAPDAERPAHGGKPFTGDAAIVAMLVVIASLLAYPYIFGSGSESPLSGEESLAGAALSTDAPGLGEQSIAVLPFTYLAATDSADYFSLGMTDELLNRLAQIEGLSVIARTSVMQYQQTDKTIPEIGRELGVAHVVEGSVQQAGGQVRIQAQLIDARTGEHRWARGFTRSFRNVLQLQSAVARQIAEALQLEILPRVRRQLAEAPEVDSAAYALYLQGRHLRFQETGPSLTQAVRLLRRSVQMDSTFAPAWAALSTTAWLVPGWGGRLPEGLRADSLARVAARRAVALDSTSAEAHVAMGSALRALDQDFPAAGRWLKKATLLNPGLANAHREYGLHLSLMGQFEEAEPHLEKASRLDPAAPAPWQALGFNAFWQERYREARRHFERALTLQSDYWLARSYLGKVYLAQGQPPAALRNIRRAVGANPSPGSLAILGQAYALIGEPDSARAVLERIRVGFGPSPTWESIIYTALGQTDRALDLLEKSDGDNFLKVSSLWDPLRDEPRYERLLEEMGLDDASVQATMAWLDAMDSPDESIRPSQ